MFIFQAIGNKYSLPPQPASSSMRFKERRLGAELAIGLIPIYGPARDVFKAFKKGHDANQYRLLAKQYEKKAEELRSQNKDHTLDNDIKQLEDYAKLLKKTYRKMRNSAISTGILGAAFVVLDGATLGGAGTLAKLGKASVMGIARAAEKGSFKFIAKHIDDISGAASRGVELLKETSVVKKVKTAIKDLIPVKKSNPSKISRTFKKTTTTTPKPAKTAAAKGASKATVAGFFDTLPGKVFLSTIRANQESLVKEAISAALNALGKTTSRNIKDITTVIWRNYSRKIYEAALSKTLEQLGEISAKGMGKKAMEDLFITTFKKNLTDAASTEITRIVPGIVQGAKAGTVIISNAINFGNPIRRFILNSPKPILYPIVQTIGHIQERNQGFGNPNKTYVAKHPLSNEDASQTKGDPDAGKKNIENTTTITDTNKATTTDTNKTSGSFYPDSLVNNKRLLTLRLTENKARTFNTKTGALPMKSQTTITLVLWPSDLLGAPGSELIKRLGGYVNNGEYSNYAPPASFDKTSKTATPQALDIQVVYNPGANQKIYPAKVTFNYNQLHGRWEGNMEVSGKAEGAPSGNYYYLAKLPDGTRAILQVGLQEQQARQEGIVLYNRVQVP